MTIEIIYKDLFEHSSQVLIDELINNHKYDLLNIGDLIRKNIRNKTQLGQQISSHFDKGELIPEDLLFETIEQEIRSFKSNNLLIQSYPKNEDQTNLFIEFCKRKNINLVRAWHMVSLNVMSNLKKVAKYNKMATKYESHGHIKISSEKTNKANNDSIEKIKKYCEVIIFESESHGVNYETDKQRIKEIIHKYIPSTK